MTSNSRVNLRQRTKPEAAVEHLCADGVLSLDHFAKSARFHARIVNLTR
jgi:hypothetical protein